MAQNSKIEWTETTWNPVVGCSKVSEGCRNCYAIRDAHRLAGNPNPKVSRVYEGLTVSHNGAANWTGKVRCLPERLEQPLRWRKPRRVFVNSMSDLFHENVPDEFIDQVFAVMALCPQHTFQILTKRPEWMLNYLSAPGRRSEVAEAMCHEAFDEWTKKGRSGKIPSPADWVDDHMTIKSLWPLPNVWLGVSVENQAAADERIPFLLEAPAAVRFVSVEPLLGPVSFEKPHLGHKEDAGDIHWVIVGGESGPNARPMHPDWARTVRDRCVAAGVPFFFKQWGEWCPSDEEHLAPLLSGTDAIYDAPDTPRRVGKKSAGRLLDGREWNEMP